VTTIAEVPAVVSLFENGVSGFTELLPFVSLTPDQEDAGSCLFMATTGMAEWWLRKLNPKMDRSPDGETDLSERYLMNISELHEDSSVKNALTDAIYNFNDNGYMAALNSEYRYSKGWAKWEEGEYVRSKKSDPEAEYSTLINWVDETPKRLNLVSLPVFDRRLLFVESTGNRWAVNVMPESIIETVKKMLIENRAPVTIIYNHYLYWHAVNIVGFDDDVSTRGCKFTNGFPEHLKKEALESRKKADKTADPEKKGKLLARAQRLEKEALSIEEAQKREGGCKPQGVFYVRDSIYSDKSEPLYDYDLKLSGEETPYSKRVIQREYQWLTRFGNHAYQIYVK
ncbi:MAG: hypothetical protein AB7H97_04695, partial [Pseudobdellovibrionaceae bacterium]